jgi:hypothetical protein
VGWRDAWWLLEGNRDGGGWVLERGDTVLRRRTCGWAREEETMREGEREKELGQVGENTSRGRTEERSSKDRKNSVA